MARDAERSAIIEIEAQLWMKRKGLDVVGMKVAPSHAAHLTGEIISLKD